MTASIDLGLNLGVHLGLNAIAQLSAMRMVDCLVEGTLVAAFAGLVLRMGRRWNSGARFAVWFSAFGGSGRAAVVRRRRVGRSRGHIYCNFDATAGNYAAGFVGALAVRGVGWNRIGWRGAGGCGFVASARAAAELRRGRFGISGPGAARNTVVSSLERKSRPATLCVSDRVSVPTVIGFVNPAVVIPRWLLQELSPSELQQILLHELAHLQRWDDWTNLAQKILKALLFFHPAAWWIEKQLSLEREMACDDVVVAETANPRAYAECLTHLAEKSFVRRSLALAQAALGRIRQTSLRVAQILDADRPSAPAHGWKPAVVLVAGFAIACAAGISRAPRLVGFEDSSPKAAQIASVSSEPNVASPSAAFLASYSSPSPRASESGITPRLGKAKFPASQPRVIPAKNTQPNLEFAQAVYWNVAIFNANDASKQTSIAPGDDLGFVLLRRIFANGSNANHGSGLRNC
jgi:hypothetical protein